VTEAGHREDRDVAHEERAVGTGDLFGELWAQALVTAEAAEEEVRRLVDRLATAADLRPRDLQAFRAALATRLSVQRRELERGLDESVRHAMGRFHLPSRAQVAALRQRVVALAARLERAETRISPAEPAEKA